MIKISKFILHKQELASLHDRMKQNYGDGGRNPAAEEYFHKLSKL